MDHGFAEASFVPDLHGRDPREFRPNWKGSAFQNRLGEVWDCDGRSRALMIQHCITALSRGFAIFAAYLWWGHAVPIVGLVWDESMPYNLRWVIRNSHDEIDFIELTGNRGVPDEAYPIRTLA
jgi:hypothetical protein